MSMFLRTSGFLTLSAGGVLLIYWYAYAIFMPYRKLSTTLALLVKNRHWGWINSLGVLGATLSVPGLAGIYVAQLGEANLPLTLGFFIATAGTVLLVGTMLWDTVLWPILVRHDEGLLDFRGPIYSSRTFLPFFVSAGIVYSLGYVLVGIGIVQSGLFPPSTGYLLALGAPLFSFGSLLGKYQVYPRTVGITAICGGLTWLGVLMIG